MLLAVPALAAAETGDPASELRTLLDRFLGATDDIGMHERFWDESLIYTSSSGARFGKSDILAGLQESSDGQGAEDAANDAPTVTYRAEAVQVMSFGETAVVAFRLIGESAEETSEYFNTGTFRRVSGEWRAVAWQATRIPAD